MVKKISKILAVILILSAVLSSCSQARYTKDDQIASTGENKIKTEDGALAHLTGLEDIELIDFRVKDVDKILEIISGLDPAFFEESTYIGSEWTHTFKCRFTSEAELKKFEALNGSIITNKNDGNEYYLVIGNGLDGHHADENGVCEVEIIRKFPETDSEDPKEITYIPSTEFDIRDIDYEETDAEKQIKVKMTLPGRWGLAPASWWPEWSAVYLEWNEEKFWYQPQLVVRYLYRVKDNVVTDEELLKSLPWYTIDYWNNHGEVVLGKTAAGYDYVRIDSDVAFRISEDYVIAMRFAVSADKEQTMLDIIDSVSFEIID